VNFKSECDEFYYVNRRNHEKDTYQVGTKKSDKVKEEPLKMVTKKKMNMIKKMVIKEEPKKVKKEKKKSDCYSLSSDDFSMESFFESTCEKKSTNIKESQKSNSMDALKKRVYEEIQRLKEEDSISTLFSKSKHIPSSQTNHILDGMEIEEVLPNHPSKEKVKRLIQSLLEKAKEGLFISQIKDEILKVYPHFQEKSYDSSYTFSKFIRSFEPEIKTRLKSEGVLYAFL
jgi:uncharacterized membrane-anchored protein YjiN (DUF445 family)